MQCSVAVVYILNKAALINKLHNIIAAQGAVIPNNGEVICERPLSRLRVSEFPKCSFASSVLVLDFMNASIYTQLLTIFLNYFALFLIGLTQIRLRIESHQ